MQAEINLKHITFKQALGCAITRAGITREELSELSGIHKSKIARFFQENDNYTPSPVLIPVLCKALGNNILVDWFNAQIEAVDEQPAIMGAKDLTDAALELTAQVGDFCAKVRQQVEDGDIARREAIESQASASAMMKFLKKLCDSLEPIASGKNDKDWRQ